MSLHAVALSSVLVVGRRAACSIQSCSKNHPGALLPPRSVTAPAGVFLESVKAIHRRLLKGIICYYPIKAILSRRRITAVTCHIPGDLLISSVIFLHDIFLSRCCVFLATFPFVSDTRYKSCRYKNTRVWLQANRVLSPPLSTFNISL